jgi:hypothetical protein
MVSVCSYSQEIERPSRKIAWQDESHQAAKLKYDLPHKDPLRELIDDFFNDDSNSCIGVSICHRDGQPKFYRANTLNKKNIPQNHKKNSQALCLYTYTFGCFFRKNSKIHA